MFTKSKKHFVSGGCAEYRNIQKEKEQMDLLIKKWGSKIVKLDSRNTKDINPVVKPPIKGV